MKVYMYDNESSDQSREIIGKHERSGFVEVRDWRFQAAQTEALNDCLCRFRHATRWMAFIDIDEFIDPAPGMPLHAKEGQTVIFKRMDGLSFPKFDADAMRERRRLLRTVLDGRDSNRHTHCMPWVHYCSPEQLSKPPGGVLENYREIEDLGERKIHMQKPIFEAQLALSLRKIGPHFLLYANENIDDQYNRRHWVEVQDARAHASN